MSLAKSSRRLRAAEHHGSRDPYIVAAASSKRTAAPKLGARAVGQRDIDSGAARVGRAGRVELEATGRVAPIFGDRAHVDAAALVSTIGATSRQRHRDELDVLHPAFAATAARRFGTSITGRPRAPARIAAPRAARPVGTHANLPVVRLAGELFGRAGIRTRRWCAGGRSEPSRLSRSDLVRRARARAAAGDAQQQEPGSETRRSQRQAVDAAVMCGQWKPGSSVALVR